MKKFPGHINSTIYSPQPFAINKNLSGALKQGSKKVADMWCKHTPSVTFTSTSHTIIISFYCLMSLWQAENQENGHVPYDENIEYYVCYAIYQLSVTENVEIHSLEHVGIHNSRALKKWTCALCLFDHRYHPLKISMFRKCYAQL